MSQTNPGSAAVEEALFDALADTDTLKPVFRNQRFVFYRLPVQGRSWFVKAAEADPPDTAALASLRHEYALLQNLDLPGIVRVAGLVRTGGGLALAMQDAGRQTLLERSAAGLSTAEFLELALQLAQALAALHAAGIVHRQITPANIVWDPATGEATLAGFGRAARLSELAADLAPVRPEGELAFVAPEQTGRTGRPVDARSDLYALGATFYQALTGAPPFAAKDPVELVHAHLARRPQPPHALRPGIPPVLSSIVLKLLEKEPERRYLGAEALAADLRAAREQWSASGALRPFVLAEHDTPRQLAIPEKLVGREEATAVLRAAFERACDGRRELVLVTGEPGIGKSALVRQLELAASARHGYFIGGKFDQLQRSLPYSGLVQALRALVLQLLTEPEAQLAGWRERILAAVGPNGRILVDTIPEIEGILGRQAPLAELGPVESKNRFNQVITALVEVFAQPAHPLVLFLDDLQWVDAASLQLIERWIAGGQRSLLIVGAYRDNEIGPAHPLARMLAQLRTAGRELPEIHLGPLERQHIAALLAGTLHRPPEACAGLAELVLKKTAGNPFFIRRLLHSLHAGGLIRFDRQARGWTWDVDEIRGAPMSDNVLELIAHTIVQLPAASRQLLQAGACIGYRFDAGILAEVTGRTTDAVLDELQPALDDGLLGRVRDQSGAAPVLRFVHDRVQQAAYSLLDERQRQALHLSIGRQLLRRAGEDGIDAAIFDVADQLNLGAALIADPDERLVLARLNLAAGRRARAAAAYQAAFDYLSAGRAQLPADGWRTHAALAYALQRDLAESAYLAGRHAEAEAELEAALAHAPTKVAQADLYGLRVLAATVAGDWDGALRWGREGLAVFGHAWPLDGLAAANAAEAAAVMRNLSGRPIDALLGEPEVTDEEIRASMHLLSILGPPAYFSGSEVLTFLVTRGTNLSLLHGPSEYSAYAYVFYGALHNALTGEYDVGYAFGKLALALAERFGNRAESSRTLEVFGLVVHCWCAPIRDSLPLMQEGHLAGVESGELAYAAFNLCGILINGLPGGIGLEELLEDAAVAIDFAARHQNRTALDISLPFRQFARSMRDETRALGSFDDDSFDEARYIEEAGNNQTAMGQFWVARLQAAVLAGDIEAALHSADQGAACIQAGILGMVTSSEHSFYTALALAARHGLAPAAEQEALAGRIRALHAQLLAWSGFCPDNYLHKHKLVEAELARLEASPWAAMTLYNEAIEAARQHGFVQDAALANELAARFFLASGQPRIAEVYLGAAADCYRKWGAGAKADALEAGRAGAAPRRRAHAAAPAGPLTLDALGLIKASQAISAENVPERLFERILQVVVEVAGAQSGVLLLGDAAALRVRARVSAEDGIATVLLDRALADDPALPASLVRYVARTREALVLADAAAEGPFAGDTRVHELGLRSILCVPLHQQQRTVGLLYLENASMASAFTAERVQVVQALAAQAVISLENSLLMLERERAEKAARFLASAASALVESLDYAHTLARVVDLAVPAFADWCVLDLAGADGAMVRAQVAFADPRQAALAEALRAFPPHAGQHHHPTARALRDGEPKLFANVGPERWALLAQGEEHHLLVQAMAPSSLIAVPLVARGRTLGALTFLLTQPGRHYGEADLALAAELADRCALAVDNAELYKAAQDAVRVREDFLAVASHELKTPLTPLLLQIHLIERRMSKLFENEESAAWLSKALATLQRQGKRLDRLVNELLDISRIAGGQLQLKLETVDLREVVDDVAARLAESQEAPASQAWLTVTGERHIRGHWDRLRLDQVIMNLLSNALKYGEGHPVTLAMTSDGSHAEIEVSDRGMGIEPEHLQRIFGRFERAVSARQYGGLGLGLYIASQIVAAMGGTIGVRSALGKGSTFTVKLPLVPE